MLSKKIKNTLELVKFSHTIFVLPFALSAFLLAFYVKFPLEINTGFFYDKILWVIIAMASARSGAMAFNRIIDAKIDALNDRTKSRTIPKGELSAAYSIIFGLLSYAVLIFSAYELNLLCFVLSPFVIVFITFYSFTKRFTFFSHFVLGASMAFGPIGAWIAVTGGIDYKIIILGTAILLWGAGFDILYAIMDYDFDVSHGLFSVPAKFGIKNSVIIARVLHLITLCLLVYIYFIFNLNYLYIAGLFLIAGFFIYEHYLIYKSLKNIDMAFFNMNGYISFSFFLFVTVSVISKLLFYK
ncbi:MAG: UbiA-like polyprenyltransferase [bacterium]